MKRLCAILLCMGLFISVSGYAAITKIEIAQVNGFQASFTAGGNIVWSGGASASLYDGINEDPIATVDDITVTAEFSQLNDNSSGGWAKATFQVVDWRVDFLEGTVFQGFIEGTNATSRVYTEVEGIEDIFSGRTNEDQLYGDAIVTVTDYDFGWLGVLFNWADPTGSLAGMTSHIWLPTGANFGDYDTDNYSTVNTTWVIYADETVIPEPATMAILGLGSLLVLRKRS